MTNTNSESRGTEHGSLVNLLSGTPRDVVPVVGMGATRLMWSDRVAYTIIAVSASGKSCTVQEDKATRIDSRGMDEAQEYTHESDPEGSTTVVRLTKRGWRSKQLGRFALGYRSSYHDFSF